MRRIWPLFLCGKKAAIFPKAMIFPISSVTTVNVTLVTVLARKNKMLSAWQVMPLICEARAVGFFIFLSLFHHVMIIVKIEGFTCIVACRLHPGGPVERTSHNNG